MSGSRGVTVDSRRLVFVAGLHRSGTTPLARLLAAHPEISGFDGTGVKEDEGQHLQDVYPSARRYGGAGRFALDPRSHLTEESPLATPENATRLARQWSQHWDLDRRLLLEKSPPNLVMTRFLQAHPDIIGVISGNDEMALGAIAALKEAGKLDQVKVGGFDGSPDAVAAVKSGEMQYTVLQPVAVFSAEAVKQADQFIKTGKTGASSEKQLFDCALITKDNVDKYTGPFTLSQ